MPKGDGTRKALVSRVKKAVKKSRRRLGAEKFEKELTRTITFLENLQRKQTTLASSSGSADKAAAKTPGKPAGKTTRKPARKAAARKPAAKKTAARKAIPKKAPAATKRAGRGAATSKKK